MDKVLPAPADTWMRHNVGRWEGDTLVVEVTGQMADTWFDRAGNYHSGDLKVVERYTPAGRDHLNYEATIEDAKIFTRPWKVAFPLYRHIEKDAEIEEFRCVEIAEPFMYGSISNPPLK